MGGHHENREKEELGKRGDCSSGCFLEFLVLLLGSAVLVNHRRGHRVAGVLGTGARIPFSIL
jgi:hypothetical protein